MTGWLADNRDYLLFVFLGLVLFVVLEAWLRLRSPRGRLPWIVWPTLVILWGAGWVVVHESGQTEARRIRDFLRGVAPTYAQEIALMGHANMRLDTPPDDPTYLRMIEAQKRWVAVNPGISDIYTIRSSPEGVRLMVDSETDYNRDGKLDQPREQRTPIGRIYAQADEGMHRALRGESAFTDEIVTDEWGVWVSAYVPLRDAQGKVEGALGVDYPAAEFLAAVAMGRSRMIWLLSVPLLILGFTTATTGALRAEIGARREVEKQLRALNVELMGRVNADEARLLSERRLALHVRHTPLAVIEWDTEFRVRAWNPAAERIFGFKADEVLGKNIANLIVPEKVYPHVDKVWNAVVGREGGARSINHNLTKDGRTILCDWHNAPLVDDNGRVIGVASHCEDITQRETMEKHLRQSQKIESLGQLAAGVAHEFNNLLTPMLLRLEMLRADRGGDKDLLAALRSIEDAIDQAAQLNQRILAVGRRSAEKRALRALNPVVEDTLALLRHTLDRRITLEVDLAPRLKPLMIDRAQVAQIVVNLTLNARDALLERCQSRVGEAWTPRVRVGTEEAEAVPPVVLGSTVQPVARLCQVITVTDNGAGMTDEVRARVFEPFYTTKAPGHGTGLGLAVVWNIVIGHDGWIDIESTRGEGTCFRVYLPSDAEGAATLAGAEPAAAEGPRGGLRVLLVDDNVFVADTLNRLLVRSGHHVTYASNGEEALMMCARAEQPFQLVVTDQNMPVMTGVELIRRLRAAGSRVPVIVVSGHLSPEFIRELEELGVNGVLAKPFTQKELLAAVSAAAGA